MLAHYQVAPVNFAKLAANLDIAGPTAKRYVELLEDLLLVRTLRPWTGNVGKRLVKSPKIYIRESGLTHALLNLKTLDDVLGHPVVGASWEGFVLENLLSCLPTGVTAWYYRTTAGAEIDLVLEQNLQHKYALEIKRSMAPTLSRGFYLGCEDVQATKRFVEFSGLDEFPISKDVMAISQLGMMKEISTMG